MGIQLKQFFTFEAIGYSFLRLWSVVFFSSSILFASLPSTHITASAFHDWSAVALIIILFISPFISRLPFIKNLRNFSIISMIAIELGTALGMASLIFEAFPPALFLTGAVLTGIGSGMLVLLWGCAFSTLPEQRVLVSTLGATVISYAMCLCLSALSFPLFCVLVLASPICSLLLLRDDFFSDNEKFSGMIETAHVLPDWKTLVKSLGAMLLAILLLSLFVGAASAFSVMTGGNVGIMRQERNLIAALILAAIVFLGGKTSWSLTTQGLLRFSTVLAAVLALLIPTIGIQSSILWYVSSLVVQAARVAIWVLLARICSGFKLSAFVCFGWGWAVHYIGLQSGDLFTRFFFASNALDNVLALAIYALVVMAFVLFSYVVGTRPLNTIRINQESTQTKLRKFDAKLADVAAHYGLTSRESELLKYLAKGYSSKAIQDELYISASTVSAHSSSIFKKMGVHSKEQVAQIVRDWEVDTLADA